MGLEEGVARQDPAPGEERLEHRGALAQALVLVAGGQDHLAAEADDVAARQVAVDRVLVADGDVADAAGAAAARGVDAGQRHGDLHHPHGAEALLVEELQLRRLVVGADGEDRLVLGERLLGEQRPRQVELAARPARVVAEGAHVIEDALDLVAGQGVAEGGHHAVERPHRAALVDDGVPVGVGLARGELAVGELGHRGREGELLLRAAASVGAVAAGAGAGVELGAAALGGRLAGRCQQQQRRDGPGKPSQALTSPRLADAGGVSARVRSLQSLRDRRSA